MIVSSRQTNPLSVIQHILVWNFCAFVVRIKLLLTINWLKVSINGKLVEILEAIWEQEGLFDCTDQGCWIC